MSIKGILIIIKKKQLKKNVWKLFMILFQSEYGVKTERKDTNQQVFNFINWSDAQFYNNWISCLIQTM